MIINYPMIRRAVEKTTIMRRHVRQVAQGIKPSEYTEFDEKLAKTIAESSGEYSKNPIKKISSWIKEFIDNIKDERNFLRNNPPQSAINTKAEDEVLDYMGFQAPLNAIKKFERMKNAQKLEAIEALDKVAFQMPLAARDAHFITKDLDTDVAANMERRLKEQLHREQGFGTWKK